MLVVHSDITRIPATKPAFTSATTTEYTAVVASCEGALRALFDVLREQHGVTGLGNRLTRDSNHDDDVEHGYFWRALNQAHDYCTILLPGEGDTIQTGDATGLDTSATLTLLLLGCWQAVARHTALEYKSAWMEYQQLRHYPDEHASPLLQLHHYTTKNRGTLRETVQQLAERCSACQRHVLVLERRRQRSWRQQR